MITFASMSMMQVDSILNNPIWHAAITNNHTFAKKHESVCYFNRDIAWFAGMQDYNEEGLMALYQVLNPHDQIILFTEEQLTLSSSWKLHLERPLAQFVFQQKQLFDIDNSSIRKLTNEHIDQMLSLTALTKPGPFFNRTIDFGNYFGIFQDGKLVSMAGNRLAPGDFMEISAVCTHPEYLGRGYASCLIQNQINFNLVSGKTPFLHAFVDNPAVALYEKLGFRLRKELIVYRLERV